MYRQAHLSPREIQVCELLIQGMELQEIADLIFRAYTTAGTHKQRAFEKLGIRNVAELNRLRVNSLMESPPDMPYSMLIGYKAALQDLLAI